MWPRTSTATCTACGRPEKAPLCGARVLPHTASSKKRVPYRKVWGAFFISIALFQPARPCRAPQAARRPHLWKRLKRAIKSCPVYSISWFRVLYWKSSGECISAARTYAVKERSLNETGIGTAAGHAPGAAPGDAAAGLLQTAVPAGIRVRPTRPPRRKPPDGT